MVGGSNPPALTRFPPIAMALDPEFLDRLRCPRTYQRLRLASPAELEAVNRQIEAGRAENVGGETVAETLAEGLVPEDGSVVYAVQDGIPVLLIDQALQLTGASPADADAD